MVTDERIALIGLRGSGKTTLGRALAERLDYAFYDSDAEIERIAGRSIRQIFAEQGEGAFRRMEESVIADLLQHRRAVLALGGGAILSPATRERLAAMARVFFLDARLDTLVRRIESDEATPGQRPPLTGHTRLLDELNELYAERSVLYRSVGDDRIDTTDKSVAALLDEVVCRLDEEARRSGAE